MSTYIAATEVSANLPVPVATLTDSSVPVSLGDLATACYEVGAEIDGAAAQAGYAVPVSPSVTGYAQVRRIAKTGAAAWALGILAPNVQGPGGKVTLADTYRKAYEDALKALREGKTILVGASPAAEGDGRELPRSFETSNVGHVRGGASPLVSMKGDW